MDVFFNLVFIGIIFYIGYRIWRAVDKSYKKHQANVNCIKNQFNGQRNSLESSLADFFTSIHGSYQSTTSNLSNLISQMKSTNSTLISTSKKDDYSSTINQCSCLVSDFDNFGMKINQLPCTRMMDTTNYGKIQKEYWDSVRSLSKDTADTVISNCKHSISSKDYSQIFAIDIETILRCVWGYATEKPYSSEAFKKAVDLFDRLYKKPHVDVTIAELYAMKQLGGEDVLRDRIHNMLKSSHSAEELTVTASALMWINAYQSENIILQHMLSTGMQMSTKTQERLHSLTNGGGKAPNGFDVSSTGSEMYFDVSALAWKDEECTGLFENLAFQEKTLSYSLAIRDEDKSLFITQGINIPDTNAILRKLNDVFAEEYGSAVTATMRNCVALSGSGEEKMEGIAVVSSECKQMGILVHVARIGKKFNIKFYTLFMPSGTRLADQKQQVLSLYKKLSPSVAMWESSMKDTVLMVIQQILNAVPQATSTVGSSSVVSDGPIF